MNKTRLYEINHISRNVRKFFIHQKIYTLFFHKNKIKLNQITEPTPYPSQFI